MYLFELEKKDLFSRHSEIYAAFRPTYPEELYTFIFSFVNKKQGAWDCATGNGQIAKRLALTFESVAATDISARQLAEAPVISNVSYSLQPAEETNFADQSFDLITVGQALHWMRAEDFFSEARRVIRPGGVLAAWGYSHLQINPEVDAIIMDFYKNVVGPFWDPARRLVEDRYASIQFPFTVVDSPEFLIRAEWSLDHLIGYLESWSATQAYIRAHRHNPVADLRKPLAAIWRGPEIPVSFPIFLKMGIL